MWRGGGWRCRSGDDAVAMTLREIHVPVRDREQAVDVGAVAGSRGDSDAHRESDAFGNARPGVSRDLSAQSFHPLDALASLDPGQQHQELLAADAGSQTTLDGRG